MEGRKLNGAEMLALALVLIGGLNWLLVGLFSFNLVTAIFGDGSLLARIVFILVGVSALYILMVLPKLLVRRASAS